MPRAFRVFLEIECFQIAFRARSAFDVQGLRDFFVRNICIRCGINFHSITSREQQHFTAAEITQQRGRSGVASEALTCFNRRGAMVETKAKKVHARRPTNSMLHKSDSATANATMQSVAIRRGAIHRKYRPCKIAPYKIQIANAKTILVQGIGSFTKNPLSSPAL